MFPEFLHPRGNDDADGATSVGACRQGAQGAAGGLLCAGGGGNDALCSTGEPDDIDEGVEKDGDGAEPMSGGGDMVRVIEVPKRRLSLVVDRFDGNLGVLSSFEPASPVSISWKGVRSGGRGRGCMRQGH